jgi:hypothetical protein
MFVKWLIGTFTRIFYGPSVNVYRVFADTTGPTIMYGCIGR